MFWPARGGPKVGGRMQRREFIGLLGSAAAAWPLQVRAQQAAMPVVGFLNTRAPGQDAHLLAAFRMGLKETGYVEGQNVAIEYRFAEGRNDRLPGMAADLVRLQVAVIAANGPAVVAAKAATTAIPIVFSVGLDPVASGLVASLNRPGGNLTGDTILFDELGPKRLELMRELVPTASLVGVLINPAYPTAEAQSRNLDAAARTLGLKILVLHASTERDFDQAFATLTQLRAGALVIGNDSFFNSRSEQLAVLMVRHALPTIFQTREFAVAGGLASYGGSIRDSYRQVGVYTGRVLKGEKPADLPVQQTTKVELIVNLKTAKALGINVPLSLLGRADEVIE
jgi:putative ABC transport system substrate-binding protein